MSYFEDRELKGLKNDILQSQECLNGSKYAFEQSLKNGLGDEIKDYISGKKQVEETRPKKKEILKNNIIKLLIGK